jgi:hypothetical protein
MGKGREVTRMAHPFMPIKGRKLRKLIQSEKLQQSSKTGVSSIELSGADARASLKIYYEAPYKSINSAILHSINPSNQISSISAGITPDHSRQQIIKSSLKK